MTLDNKSKYQAFGMQFTDNCFRCNHVVALSFRKVASSTADDVTTLAREVTVDMIGKQFDDLFGLAIQGGAATKVAKDLGFEEEVCDMHDGDKVGASAIGELVRKRGGRIINAFDTGTDLLKKLHNQAKHFCSSHTNRANYDRILIQNPGLPRTTINRDLNTTRISSVYNLLRSSLRLKRSLQMYYTVYNLQPYLSDVDWIFYGEAEAILRASKIMVTLVQTETKLIAAFAPIIRKKLHDAFTSDTMDLIYDRDWTDQAHPPRVSMDVNNFSDGGRACRRRALLETERRFFGNESDDLMSELAQLALLKLTQREKATLVLDKRTCGRSQILSKEGWRDAIDALKVFYVEFYVQCKAYDRNKARRNAPPPAETDSVDSDHQESNDSDLEEPVQDDDDMLPLRRHNHNANTPVIPGVINEEQRQEEDKVSAKHKFDDIIYDWYELKINRREVYTKK